MEAALSQQNLPASDPITAQPSEAVADPLKNLRLLVYLYIGLWVFEGALRKWIVPGLSGPLLIIRDPVLLAIYVEAMRQKVFRFDGFTTSICLLGILSTVISLGLPDSAPPAVIFFGFRANFLHLPLIFLLPRILEYRHVRVVGSFILWISAPMAFLVALQFIAPNSHLNAGAGGNDGSMLETSGGRIRPSGTFSFTNGMAEFTGLAGAFLIHQLLERGVFPKLAFLSAAPALLVMVLLSGSRTTFGMIVMLLMAVVAIWIIKPRFMRSSLKFFAIGFAIVAIVGSFSVLKVGISVLAERFGDQKNVKEGFVLRLFEEFTKPIDTIARAQFFGVGVGMGTNVASSMMYGKVRFMLGESEYDRVILEMGPLLGLSYIGWRMIAALRIAQQSVFALRRDNNTLPLLLFTATVINLLLGQFGQTTTLGFSCLGAGLALAATRRNETSDPATPVSLAVARPIQPLRGRSRYATQLIPDDAPAISPIPENARPLGRSPFSEQITTDTINPLPVEKPAAPLRRRKKPSAVAKSTRAAD